jgi:ferric-dicitrate binding protein FerR (iron transport regulator)
MERSDNYYDMLIAKAFSGNASPDELRELEEWKSRSGENIRLFRKSLKLWETNPFWISRTTINDDYNRISFRIIGDISDPGKKQKNVILYKAAAVLLIPLLIAFGWYYLQSTQNDRPVQYTEVIAPEGQISKCILADGTEVWLNSGTNIRYDNRYNEHYRDIILDGEAYFKVSADKAKPFRVLTNAIKIQVHGTSFNVSAYKSCKAVETILEEGSVEIILKEQKDHAVFIKPGEKAVYDIENQKVNIEKVDTELYTAWHEGKFLFKDAALSDIFKKLEQVYGISIELEDIEIGRIRLRGIFEYNHNIVDALFKIKMTTDLNYRIQGRTVYINRDK